MRFSMRRARADLAWLSGNAWSRSAKLHYKMYFGYPSVFQNVILMTFVVTCLVS
jgi:hypothetical protein